MPACEEWRGGRFDCGSSPSSPSPAIPDAAAPSSKMPSDDTRAGSLYTSTRPRPHRPSTFPISTRKLLLLLAFTALYSLFAIHNDLPPWSWIENYKHRNDKVVLHRPGFKKVERCVVRVRERGGS